jgi:hypothetical protein
MPRRRTVSVESPVQCTVCGGQHVLHGVAELVRQPIAFGGGGDQPDDAPTRAPWTVTLTCPRWEKPFEGSVLVPAHTRAESGLGTSIGDSPRVARYLRRRLQSRPRASLMPMVPRAVAPVRFATRDRRCGETWTRIPPSPPSVSPG